VATALALITRMEQKCALVPVFNSEKQMSTLIPSNNKLIRNHPQHI
jgi:hypothetical protein